MGKKFIIFLVLMLVLGSALVGCSSDEKDVEQSKEVGLADDQVLNLYETAEIPSMDVSKATDQVSFIVMDNVMEGLYRLGKDDETELGVAKYAPVVSDDGLTWTITLKDNARWSNGDIITAHDFVYSWQRAVDPATGSEYAYMFDPVLNAKDIYSGVKPVSELGVKAIDDTHLEVSLAYAAPYFDALLSFPTFYPQQEKFVKEQGDKYGTEADAVLYNGPFALSDWKHEAGWTYVKNENYWDKETVKLSQINVKVVKDANTALGLYKTGEVDRVNLAPEQIKQNDTRSDFNTQKDTSVYFLRLNESNPFLSNVNARKAINMAMDKQSFTDVLLANGSVPADYLVPSDFVFDGKGVDFREANGSMNTYNVEAAKALWAKAKDEAGVSEVTLGLLNYDTDVAKKIGEWMKEELEKNLDGLTVELRSMPFKQKLEMESNLDYDMSYAGWGPDYPDSMTFLDMFVTDGAHNQMKYSNQAYDKLIQESADLANDPEMRTSELQKAEKILIEEDQAIAPLYQKGYAYLQSPKVKDIYEHKFGGDYSYKWTYVEK